MAKSTVTRPPALAGLDPNDHTLWHPYAQMKTQSAPIRVDSAHGVMLNTEKGPLIDAISSWWSVIHGYNHPQINQAAIQQIDQMAHCMLGGLVHEPAKKCADLLVKITPPSLQHVFFSDSGSVAVEVAMKMAIQRQVNNGIQQKNRLVYLQGAYHGDTTGVMGICDPEEGMHHVFKDILLDHIMLPIPESLRTLDAVPSQQDKQDLHRFFEKHHHRLAGFVFEPLVQGAIGFRFYSREWLEDVVRICRHYDILVIADEIATGCGRTGDMWACDALDFEPDIICTGKGLTAGYCGHAATITNHKVYDAFYSDDPEHALMHGPTFMGNPTATAVASASIRLLMSPHYLDNIKRIERQLVKLLSGFQHPNITDIRIFGAIGVIEVRDTSILKDVQDHAVRKGVWLRPFRNIIYTAPPYIITDNELEKVVSAMKAIFE